MASNLSAGSESLFVFNCRFRRAVHAIVAAVLRDRVGESCRADVDRVAEFVREQHGRMPDYLQFPLKVLTLVFDSWPGLPWPGRSFHRLSESERSRVLAAWKRSRIGFRRDLVKFYESLAVFGLAWETEDHLGR